MSFKQRRIYSETHSLTFYCGNIKNIWKPQDRTLNEVRCAVANSPPCHPAHFSQQMKGEEMSEACSMRGIEDRYIFAVCKPRENRPNWIHTRRWGNDIKIGVTNTGCKVECWVDLSQDGEQRWVLVKLVTKTEFCTRRVIYLLSEQVLLCQITLNRINVLILY